MAHKIRALPIGTGALTLLLLTAAAPLQAQDPDVPHTPTFPRLEEAPYPYVEPAEVGLSAERLERLGDQVAGWGRDSSIVGSEPR